MDLHATTRVCVCARAQWSFPFDRPVDTSQYKDYLAVVHTPMDFETMRIKLDNGHYIEPNEFWHDLKLIFDNARKYNPRGSDVFLMADTLQVQACGTRAHAHIHPPTYTHAHTPTRAHAHTYAHACGRARAHPSWHGLGLRAQQPRAHVRSVLA